MVLEHAKNFSEISIFITIYFINIKKLPIPGGTWPNMLSLVFLVASAGSNRWWVLELVSALKKLSFELVAPAWDPNMLSFACWELCEPNILSLVLYWQEVGWNKWSLLVGIFWNMLSSLFPGSESSHFHDLIIQIIYFCFYYFIRPIWYRGKNRQSWN